MNEKDALLQKSGRAFAAVELLLQADSLEAAASRTYYAWFYIAEALLLSHGLRFSSHGQVIAQYGLNFAKENVLERRFHRTLDEKTGYASTQIMLSLPTSTVARSSECYGKAKLSSTRRGTTSNARARKVPPSRSRSRESY